MLEKLLLLFVLLLVVLGDRIHNNNNNNNNNNNDLFAARLRAAQSLVHNTINNNKNETSQDENNNNNNNKHHYSNNNNKHHHHHHHHDDEEETTTTENEQQQQQLEQDDNNNNNNDLAHMTSQAEEVSGVKFNPTTVKLMGDPKAMGEVNGLTSDLVKFSNKLQVKQQQQQLEPDLKGFLPAGAGTRPAATAIRRLRTMERREEHDLEGMPLGAAEEIAAAFESLISYYKPLGAIINLQRIFENDKIRNIQPLTEAEGAWLSAVLPPQTELTPKMKFMEYTPITQIEKTHLYLTTLQIDKDWLQKRDYVETYDQWTTAVEKGDHQTKSLARATLEKMGNQATNKMTFQEISTAIAQVLPAFKLHGMPLLSDWERRTADEEMKHVVAGHPNVPNTLSKVSMMSPDQLANLAMNPKAADQQRTGIDKAVGIAHSVAQRPDPADTLAALKNWVSPKYTNFEYKPGDQCPHIVGDGTVLTLHYSRYEADSRMFSVLGKKQLCWMCRSVVTIIQGEAHTPYGTSWDTQTDLLNRGVTVACDRIVEVNSSPHWQSDCKNLIEYWGPEILCRLENAGDEIQNLPQLTAGSRSSVSEEEQYQIEKSFSKLSLELCAKLTLSYTILSKESYVSVSAKDTMCLPDPPP